MAQSIAKQSEATLNINQTWSFIWKKLKPILLYHLIVNAAMLLAKIVFRHPSVEEIVGGFSSFFFMPVLGFNGHGWLLGAEWYIGYMLFAMIVIYPFLRRWLSIIVDYVAPICGFFLFGYLASKYGSVMETDRMIRAFGGLLLGIAAYGITRKINWNHLKGVKRYILGAYPVIIIVAYIFYMNSNLMRDMQPFMVILIWSALIVTFSEKGFFSGKKILNNSFIYWLGTISLPVYMVQNFTREVVGTLLENRTERTVFLSEIIVTVVVGVGLYYTVSLLMKHKVRI